MTVELNKHKIDNNNIIIYFIFFKNIIICIEYNYISTNKFQDVTNNIF